MLRQQVEAVAVLLLQQPGGAGVGFALVPTVADCKLEAASDLQKRVLFGSARHWAQVPGPEVHGLAIVVAAGYCDGREVETSPSEGGGVKPCCESW